MSGHVLRISRQHGELLLRHHLLHVFAELHDLLRVARLLQVELLVDHAALLLRVALRPHALVVESNVVVQLLFELHHSVLEAGKGRRRFLICKEQRSVKNLQSRRSNRV